MTTVSEANFMTNRDFLKINPTKAEQRNTLGRTPLLQAAADGYLMAVKTLVEQTGVDKSYVKSYKTDNESMAIHLAADNGHVDVVAYFVNLDKKLVEAKDKDGNMALGRAAYKGQKAVVEYLIKQGADIEAKGYRGRTAIMRAAAKGHCQVIDTLVTNGADIDAVSSDEDLNKGAIHFAAVFGHTETVRQLVALDPKQVSKTNKHGENALMYAAIGGHVGVIEYFVEKLQQSIDTRGRYGRTPLMSAARYGHKEAVEYLEKSGADTTTVDDNGETASDLATKFDEFIQAQTKTRHDGH